ncbi:MAG: CoA-binding protein [Gammaproteobacteria bacterium]|nr:MAG: CoA-binding protein [Gammaproteobacteria bacterium]
MNPLNANFSTEIDYLHITKELDAILANDRDALLEHEVYQLLNLTGAIASPICQFIETGTSVTEQQLGHFNGDKVVLKIVSPSIIHKTEATGVRIVENDPKVIAETIIAMENEIPRVLQQYFEKHSYKGAQQAHRSLSGQQLKEAIKNDIQGVLIVEFIPLDHRFGSEVLIGIRNTREFGLTISAGLGGTDTEIFAAGFAWGQAMVSASVELNDGQSFFNHFKDSLCYQLLSGQTRGRDRLISDEILIAQFDSLIKLAKYYSPSNPDAPYIIEELEINPLAVVEGKLRPLDGMCRFSLPKPLPNDLPIHKIDKLMHPSSIGIIGVSANKMNFGRIILSNLVGSGYEKSKITIIKPDCDEIDGIKCTESLSALDHKLDLFIVAVGSDAVFGLVDEMIATDSVETVMLIPGGLGETEASRERTAEMIAKINKTHGTENGGPIFLGGNCLGVVSHPGGYDSWFIPKEKLPLPEKKAVRNSAFISQSGAFMITRISKNPWFDPAYMAALGNQNDISHGDMLSYFVDNPVVDIIGVYIEGFNDRDGLKFAKAVRRATAKGKQVVVYKAGRSSAGQDAAMGHTASIAGDYAVCEEILQQSGAITCSSISEFNDVFYLANKMFSKTISGNRLGAVSGAGFETVGMADSIHVENLSMEMAELTEATNQRLKEILAAKRLDALMEVRNPFDINPGADDEAHLLCAEAMIEDPNVDAVVLGLDPLSPMMRTMDKSRRPGFDIHSDESVVQMMPKLVAAQDKPIIGVMDGGDLYHMATDMLKDSDVAIFRSCDRAVAALTKYIHGRLQAKKLLE